MKIKHPAKFSDPILLRIAEMIDDWGWPARILDPFAGTGRVHELTAGWTCGVEIEPEWAALTRNTVVANSLRLPFPDASFDAMVTSPCYGNRYADHHNAKDGSERRSYTHDLRASTGDPGRSLHPDNAGTLPWGRAYREFHDAAWAEALRCLAPNALIVLNVSNFFRTVNGMPAEQLVTEWHLAWFMEHECSVLDIDHVYTRRMRKGANRDARKPYEVLIAMRYQADGGGRSRINQPLHLEESHGDSDVLTDPPLGTRLAHHLDA